MSRLTQQDWIAAGFRTLTQNGPDTLKAEPLARSLKATKGSFYWHFKDVPAFKTDMLSHWEETATSEIIDALSGITQPVQRLRMLTKVSTGDDESYGGIGAEPAIRAWAKSDPSVADALRRVDQTRLDYVKALFDDMGLTNPDLSKLLYAALIGLQELGEGETPAASNPMETLVDLMIALSETD